MQAYSDNDREDDPHALPDIEVFELTAREVAQGDEDLIWDYSKRYEHRLSNMNSKAHEAMIDAIVEEEEIKGGWFYWFCFPGCLPDSGPIGPFESAKEAKREAQGHREEL